MSDYAREVKLAFVPFFVRSFGGAKEVISFLAGAENIINPITQFK